MRINKFISETGYCSRREADKLVDAGRVTINGQLAELGSQAEGVDDVRIDGQRIGERKSYIYLMLNKPVGITCTTELHIEGNIVDYVGHSERIFPIGRLDKDSEGLILLTNDGDVVNPILRSEGKHEKEYIVTVDKPVTEQFLRGMSEGVHILGSLTLPCEVYRTGERVFRMILTEGRNRQIRRMCEAFGFHVRKLKRVRVMNIRLDEQPVGEWRELTDTERLDLFRTLDYTPGLGTGKPQSQTSESDVKAQPRHALKTPVREMERSNPSEMPAGNKPGNQSGRTRGNRWAGFQD